MKWIFSSDAGSRRKDEVVRLNSVIDEGPILACRLVNNHLWQVVERTLDGTRFIRLYILKSGPKGFGWGSCVFDEIEAPPRHDCPLTLLNMCSPPQNERAATWRKEVALYNEKRKAMPKLVEGLKLRYEGVTYELISFLGGREGWHVCDQNGKKYQFGPQLLAKIARDASVV